MSAAVKPLPVLLISATVGLIQVGLSVAAGVHSDIAQGDLHRFGYLRSFHWSLTYIVIMPVILAASLPAALALYKSRTLAAHRIAFYLPLFFAAVFATATAGAEGWNTWVPIPKNPTYLQWNSFNAVDLPYAYSTSLGRFLHLALFWIGYGHYFVGCFFGSVIGTGVLVYFVMVSREHRSGAPLSALEIGLLQSQRTAVVGYLLFLAVLRSSKVSMHLEAKGVSVKLEKIGDFVTNANPYFELIFDGLIQDLAFGLFWIAVALWTHASAWGMSTASKSTGLIQDLFHPIAGAYELLGGSTRFWVGVSIVGIMLPPPGFQYLVAVCTLIAGLHLIKSSNKT